MYATELNLVVCRRVHSLCSGTADPSAARPLTLFGTTVNAQRTPVKPAVLLNERNSIATSRAPGISKIECGIFSSVMYASYAASKRMTASFALAYCTHCVSRSRDATAPVGLFGKQR